MRRLLLLATAALTMWGCSKDPIADDAAQGGYSSDVVSITTYVPTRGTPVNDVSQMTDMGVFGYNTGQSPWNETTDLPDVMFDQRLYRNGTAWLYDGTPVQWGSTSASDLYTFFAYAPFATANNGIEVTSPSPTVGVPTLEYTVPTDVTKQPDLMVAVPRKDIVKPPTGYVSLQMEHALTCVGFQVKGNGEQIKDIAIKGVSMTGTLEMDGSAISWSNPGTPAAATSFSASLNYDAGQSYYTATSEISTDLIKGNGYLMMIPQTLGADAKVVVTLNDDSAVEIGLDTYEWTAGKKVTYNINMKERLLYVGNFAGDLKKMNNGRWRFERKLYIQAKDESAGIAWGPEGNVTSVTNFTLGKQNTLTLNNMSSALYPAANLCFKKNDNWSGITAITDPDYNWYLPAQKQLMAVWVIHESFDDDDKLAIPEHSPDGTPFWSSTEHDAMSPWFMKASEGYVDNNTNTSSAPDPNRLYKSALLWVRCVREE